MDLVSGLTSLAASVKATSELMILVHKMKVSDAVAEKAAELNSHILSLQQDSLTMLAQNQTLLREKEELERKIIEVENWKEEAAKYKMITPSPAVTFYPPMPHAQDSA